MHNHMEVGNTRTSFDVYHLASQRIAHKIRVH